ncbi:hypothetical protein [Timonella sp. A28]|uniref:hypothetical protein n=1 Tax=Timonella sp. A28 TaxID=3442640 RepID=UPI003EC0989A
MNDHSSSSQSSDLLLRPVPKFLALLTAEPKQAYQKILSTASDIGDCSHEEAAAPQYFFDQERSLVLIRSQKQLDVPSTLGTVIKQKPVLNGLAHQTLHISIRMETAFSFIFSPPADLGLHVPTLPKTQTQNALRSSDSGTALQTIELNILGQIIDPKVFNSALHDGVGDHKESGLGLIRTYPTTRWNHPRFR